RRTCATAPSRSRRLPASAARSSGPPRRATWPSAARTMRSKRWSPSGIRAAPRSSRSSASPVIAPRSSCTATPRSSTRRYCSATRGPSRSSRPPGRSHRAGKKAIDKTMKSRWRPPAVAPTSRVGRHVLTALAVIVAAASIPASAARAADPLASWNDGKAKQAIVEFVAKVTTEGGPDFVPPAERIATFDNDGTLWAEQPLYFQLLFAIDRVKALAPRHPEWKSKEPFASLLKGDLKTALAGGDHAIAQIIGATHGGLTTTEFDALAKAWLAGAKHPRFQRT